MKKLILALAFGAVAANASAQGNDLRVAIDPTYEPFTFKTADGKPRASTWTSPAPYANRSNASACLSSRSGTA